MFPAAPAKKNAYTEFLCCHKGGTSLCYSIFDYKGWRELRFAGEAEEANIAGKKKRKVQGWE
jgi:hypothetical protein